MPAAAPPATVKRIALVIGNADYLQLPLPNPVNDAQDVASALRRLGFEVIERSNVPARGMRSAIREFTEQLDDFAVALVFYAGHGTQIDAENYLIPIDSIPSVRLTDPAPLYSVSTLIREMRGPNPDSRRTNILILDACRNLLGANQDPNRAVGLARLKDSAQTFVAFASAYGTVARDGQASRHSPYSEALLAHLPTPGLSLSDLFQRVRTDVERTTNRAQSPREESGLTGYQSTVLSGQAPALANSGAAPGRGAAPGTRAAGTTQSLPAIITALPEGERFSALRERVEAFSYRLSAAEAAQILASLPVPSLQGATMLLLPTLPDAMPASDLMQLMSAVKDPNALSMLLGTLGSQGKFPNALTPREFVTIGQALQGMPRATAVQALRPAVRGQLSVDDMIVLVRDPTGGVTPIMIMRYLLEGRPELTPADAIRLTGSLEAGGVAGGIQADATKVQGLMELTKYVVGTFTSAQLRDLISGFAQPIRLGALQVVKASGHFPPLTPADRTMLVNAIGGPNPQFLTRQFNLMFP